MNLKYEINSQSWDMPIHTHTHAHAHRHRDINVSGMLFSLHTKSLAEVPFVVPDQPCHISTDSSIPVWKSFCEVIKAILRSSYKSSECELT